MKITKRWLIALLSAALAVGSIALISACGKKEAKEVTLTFVTNGGTAVDPITAKAGETVALPASEREHFTFDGWHLDPALGDEVLPASIAAPKEDTSYYASWTEDAKAGYTVYVYFQNVAKTGYRLESAKTYDGTGYVGERVTPDLAFEHFTYAEDPKLATGNPTPVSELTLSANSDENIFYLYYDRMSYTVSYSAALPDALVRGSVPAQTVPYGGSIPASENGFTAEGYRFVGWSTKREGEIGEDDIYGGAFHAEKLIEVLGPTTLYAVWDKAYTDRAGSGDLLYFPRLEEGVAYMQRGGHEFEGEREGNSFSFKKEDGTVMLEGVVSGDFFAYKNAAAEATYVLYDNYSDPKYSGITDPARYDTAVTLHLDEYLNAEYTDKEGKTHAGALSFDDTRGDYLLTFSDGTKSLYVRFDKTDTGPHRNIFMIAGNEAGYYVELLALDLPYTTGEMLVLDGYGLATLYLNTAGGVFLGFDGTYYVPSVIADAATDTSMYKVFVDIIDEYGMLESEPGEYASYVMTIPLDTTELGEEFNGYIISNGLYLGFGADDEELLYEGEDGETLFLDGLGYFGDSAVYTDKAGKAHRGSYAYSDDTYSGFIVTVTETEGGETFSFRLNTDRSGYTFSHYDAAQAVPYREYRHMTSVLDYPVLVLFDETVEVGGVQRPRAEIWIADNGEEAFKGGDGWYETDTTLGIPIYTFHRTGYTQGYAAQVPVTLKFYTTQVYRSDNNRLIDVFILLEEDGEKHYREYTLADGNTLWGNSDSIVVGVGSLLIGKDGRVITEGSFSQGVNSYFNLSYLQFVYGDGAGNTVTRRFVAEEGDVWKEVEGIELELQIYRYIEASDENEQDTAGFFMDLVLDNFLIGDTLAREGRAVYDYGNAAQPVWQEATYKVVGVTDFGENIYALTIAGEEVFRFVVTLFTDSSGNADYVYFIEDASLTGIFSSPDGGQLRLDGFYWAEYIDGAGNRFEGTYSVDPDGDELYFTPVEGTDFYISVEKEKRAFYPLDAAYGTWIVVDYNMNPVGGGAESGDYLVFDFDGRGNAAVHTLGGSSPATGIYEAVNAENYEYRVKIALPVSGIAPSADGWWYIQLYPYNDRLAILYDEENAGTFVGENWDVLWLDGFGGGTLYTAGGGISATGMYTVLDADKGFLMFTYGENENAFLIFDTAARSFRILDYSDVGGVWFAEDLDYVAFGRDGFFQIGARGDDIEIKSGVYFFDEENIYMVNYLFEETVLPLPTAQTSTLSLGGKTYYRPQLSDGVLTLKGKVNFFDRDGKTPLTTVSSLDVTLALSVNIGANYNNAATIVVEEGEFADTYGGFVFNIYTNGAVNPRISYQDFTYFVTFRFDGTSASTFNISAGYTSVVMNDFYSGLQVGGEEGTGNYTGGEITKEILGFGPITFAETLYSGRFLYENKNPSLKAEPVVFKDVPQSQVRVLGHRSDLNGDLLEILFDVSGKRYAVDFVESYAEEVGACYILWGFYRYEERQLSSGGKTYTLGLKHLIRATAAGTPGYGHDGYNLNPSDLFDEVVYVTLIEGEDIVEAVDSGVTLGGDGVWMIVAKQGGGFSGYLFTFSKDAQGAIEEVTLEIGNFASAEAVGGYLVYFLTDENGNATRLLAVYCRNESGLYALMEDVRDVEGSAGTWSFFGKAAGGMERRYTVSIDRNEEGRYVVTVTAAD